MTRLTYPIHQEGSLPFQAAALKGLSAFRFGVELACDASPEGLSTEWIREQCEERLRAAGIPVVSPDDDGQDAGSTPALSVSAAAKIVVERPPALYVLELNCRVYQVARLERDPSTKLLLDTWSCGCMGVAFEQNIGETIKTGVLDRVDFFIDTYRSVNGPGSNSTTHHAQG